MDLKRIKGPEACQFPRRTLSKNENKSRAFRIMRKPLHCMFFIILNLKRQTHGAFTNAYINKKLL